MLDTSRWFAKGIIRSLAYEFIQEYRLTDEQINKLCLYLSMVFINEIYYYYQIDEDIENPAYVLNAGQKEQELYILMHHPELFKDTVYQLSIKYKDPERVIEDYYLHYLIIDKFGPYDYDDYKELKRDVYCYILDNKEEMLRNIKIEPIKRQP